MPSFIAFVLAAVLFFLNAIEAKFAGPHKIDWGLCLVAIGLALAYLPWSDVTLRRQASPQ